MPTFFSRTGRNPTLCIGSESCAATGSACSAKPHATATSEIAIRAFPNFRNARTYLVSSPEQRPSELCLLLAFVFHFFRRSFLLRRALGQISALARKIRGSRRHRDLCVR